MVESIAERMAALLSQAKTHSSDGLGPRDTARSSDRAGRPTRIQGREVLSPKTHRDPLAWPMCATECRERGSEGVDTLVIAYVGRDLQFR